MLRWNAAILSQCVLKVCLYIMNDIQGIGSKSKNSRKELGVRLTDRLLLIEWLQRNRSLVFMILPLDFSENSSIFEITVIYVSTHLRMFGIILEK